MSDTNWSYLKPNINDLREFDWPTEFDESPGYRILFNFPEGEIKIGQDEWKSSVFDYFTPLVVNSTTYNKMKVINNKKELTTFMCWELVLPKDLSCKLKHLYLPIGKIHMYSVEDLTIKPKQNDLKQLYEHQPSNIVDFVQILLSTAYAFEYANSIDRSHSRSVTLHSSSLEEDRSI
jgi:hypothetical protein